MPRRRSDGLSPGTALAGAAAGLLVATVAAAGCQSGTSDTGCQLTRQIVLPDTTALALLPAVRIDRLGNGLIVFGADATSVRWTVIDAAGSVGAEQAVALPAGTLHAYYAVAGAASPGDTVIVGALLPAPNPTDAQLRFIAAPIDDGAGAGAPGTAVVTFPGGADPQNPLPMIAMGTSATATYAGAAWLDPSSGFPSYVFLDGQAQVVSGPAVVESDPAPAYSCLGFGPGMQELTISYQKAAVDPLIGPTWLIADVSVGGGVSTLRLNVAQPNGTMSCALGVVYDQMTAGASPEYAIVWQDSSGSWLSIYNGSMVKSFPFASSTDFGGADLQPPLVGLSTFPLTSDFGVLFVRPHSVEMWRVDRAGNRRSGSLVYPSLQGDISGVSAVGAPKGLSSTYADLTGASTGRRLIVDAVCY